MLKQAKYKHIIKISRKIWAAVSSWSAYKVQSNQSLIFCQLPAYLLLRLDLSSTHAAFNDNTVYSYATSMTELEWNVKIW